MSDLLSTFPGLVADAIKADIAGLRECRAVAGRFDLRRLTETGINAPAVMVSLLRLNSDEHFAGRHDAYLMHMGAFVVTKDAMGLPRDHAAALIAQAIVSRVSGAVWGRDDCGEARDLRVEPVVSAGTLKAAASLWAVTWSQPCVLQGIDPGQPLDLSVFVSTVPEVGAAHEDDYEQIGGAS